ncbi:hypothetical protein GCM10007063_18260 [Lentibacillus kapialis]|uniref:Uncharacterized protein n=1 Tax=Lentibacillus kapialis TaxID=340214 RepID=A0A917PX26_9BACI|nr:hypothetical protein [Lentibacillus kapialis]GGJ96143.1 hypothetical protein GCM10007063_18260 [Lentibacillus kapialis]
MKSKGYSWLSELSFGIPILLIALLFIFPNTSLDPLIIAIAYAQFLGIPLAVILSIIVLFKKNERKILAMFGLLLSIILISVISFFVYLGMNFTP